jgi:hypothetical protein
MMLFLRSSILLMSVWLLATGCGGGGGPDEVVGEIRISPDLVSEIPRNPLLIIRAHRPDTPSTILAEQRIRNPQFPLRYFLGRPDLKGNGLNGPLVITASLRGDELSGDTVKPFALEGRSDGNTNAGLSNANILIKKRTPIKLPPRAKQTATGPSKAVQTPPSTAGASSGDTRKTISGSISVSPTVGEPLGGGVIFIVVRAAGVDKGPPLAVKQMRNSGFPLRYVVSESNVMMAGMPFQGRVNVTVRLDGDGQVGSRPGDLEGRTKAPVAVGDEGVDIVLDKRH